MIRVRIVRRPHRVLDFDCEARATGYGDPNWVPQEVTAIAWSWIEDEEVVCRIRKGGAKRMLQAFRRVYLSADVLTGHNIRKFDLPLINAECIRHGLEPLERKLTQDTLRDIVRTHGMKRDQDNLGKFLRTEVGKTPMAWQDWQDAYNEKGWPMVRERVVNDVRQHKLMRLEMLDRGWLKPPRPWTP